MSKARFGFCTPAWTGAGPWDHHLDYKLIKTTVLQSERLGYDSLWIPDHLMLGHNNENYEAWTLMSALTQITERMHLGTLVTCPTHRTPGMLAKTAATIDVISEGRVELGIGAGWMRTEQMAYGLPWSNVAKERIGRMVDTIKIVKGMWENDSFTYKGQYYSVEDAVCTPKPIQKPHPNIWIGGGGEKLTMKMAAKYADGWNIGEADPEGYRKKLEVLRAHCTKQGTDYDHIQKSLETYVLITDRPEDLEATKDWGNASTAELFQQLKLNIKPPAGDLAAWKNRYIMGTQKEVTDRVAEYINAGVQLFQIYFIDYPTFSTMDAFARDVIPSL